MKFLVSFVLFSIFRMPSFISFIITSLGCNSSLFIYILYIYIKKEINHCKAKNSFVVRTKLVDNDMVPDAMLLWILQFGKLIRWVESYILTSRTWTLIFNELSSAGWQLANGKWQMAIRQPYLFFDFWA